MSAETSYRVNGRSVSRTEALAAVGADLPDDASAVRVTWIGADSADATRLASAAKAAGAAYQSYPSADTPMLTGLGFRSGLYAQKSTGEVLHYSSAIPAAGQLDRVLAGAERRADPNYDPAKDPDLSRPAPPPAPSPSPGPSPSPSPGPSPNVSPAITSVPPAVYAMGVAAVLMLGVVVLRRP